jgi:SAM-dependent methyltransferase
MIPKKRYPRVLEIGCGGGTFARKLAGMADYVLAVDISETAIARARMVETNAEAIDFRVVNIMEYDPVREGPWSLIVMSETIYYLGWLYSFFEVAWLASQLFQATRDDGHLLLANTFGILEDQLVLPWLIRTYRDLFGNVGYHLEAEEVFRGTKDSVELEVLMSRFGKRESGAGREESSGPEPAAGWPDSPPRPRNR